MSDTGLDLVKRIARLVRQNQELVRENEDLKNLISRLREENQDLRIKVPDSKENRKQQKQGARHSSLKFDMATVMFANIFGFSKIGEDYDSVKLMDELDSIVFLLYGLTFARI
jgi:regulator of replication initiation timing